MKKHVGVLEDAGLVVTQKVGRVRTCKLGRRALDDTAAWIARYRQSWAAAALDAALEGGAGGGMMPEQFEQLDAVLIELGAGG